MINGTKEETKHERKWFIKESIRKRKRNKQKQASNKTNK